jgi:hypothetical protein
VVDIIGTSSATVQAFRRIPLPESGMTVNMPVITQYPDAGHVTTAEKTQVPTRAMTIDPAAFAVKTYAGGQDVSIQAIMRSSPAYLDVLMRAFIKQMATALDQDAAAAVVAAAVPTMPLSAADINGSFVDAAARLLQTTLSFPQVLVMGVDAWSTMAKAVDTAGRPLFPTVSPVNPVGSFNITQSDGNVRGLAYWVDPLMAPGAAVLGVVDAFVTLAGPVGTLTVDVPAVLGRDVAVYQFAAMGATDPRGLVGLTLGALAADTASGSTRKSAN